MLRLVLNPEISDIVEREKWRDGHQRTRTQARSTPTGAARNRADDEGPDANPSECQSATEPIAVMDTLATFTNASWRNCDRRRNRAFGTCMKLLTNASRPSPRTIPVASAVSE